MNTYYSYMGRIIDEKTPMDKPGYFVLCEGHQVKFCSEAPTDVRIVTKDMFIDALVEGCKNVINQFAASEDNENVYAFNLSADEHYSFYIYINTLSSFDQTLESYQSKYPDKYQDEKAVRSLKYNQGDFDFEFWQEHMGEHGDIISEFENLANLVQDFEDDQLLEQQEGEIVAFEAGIIKEGYYLLAVKAVQLLIEEGAFASLHTTEDFIAFAATGNDYVDYSLTMRKTIPQELLYSVFPEVRQADQKFESMMETTRNMSVGDFLDYWMDAVHSGYNLGEPYESLKFEYDIFLQLERYGNELAVESLNRLMQYEIESDLSREQSDEISYYIEALHFAGELTEQQKEVGSSIAQKLQSSEDKFLYNQLKVLL